MREKKGNKGANLVPNKSPKANSKDSDLSGNAFVYSLDTATGGVVVYMRDRWCKAIQDVYTRLDQREIELARNKCEACKHGVLHETSDLYCTKEGFSYEGRDKD